MQAEGSFLYRCYGPNSAGSLTAGAIAILGMQPRQMSNSELRVEFSLHRQKNSRNPTRLVSATTSFLRALTHVFKLLRNPENDPHQVMLAFIYVPPEDKDNFHRAQDLVDTDDPERGFFASEVVFEWYIKSRFVTHRVSANTLIERGLLEQLPWAQADDLDTKQTRKVVKEWFGPEHYGVECSGYANHYFEAFDAGFGACRVGLSFGFNAPYAKITKVLLQETWPEQYWHALEDGIESVVESTFADPDFLRVLAERDEAQDLLAEESHDILISAYELLQENGDEEGAKMYYNKCMRDAEQSYHDVLSQLGF